MSATLVIGNKTYSSWSMRGWLAARKTPLPFTERQLWLDTPGFADEIAPLSPSRRVPALHVDGEVIWDSLAIGEYLAERYPEAGLLPADPLARARLRSVCAEMHAGFGSLRATLPFNCRAQGRRVEFGAATSADIVRVCDIWRDCLARSGADGGLFGGFTLADAMYVPVALRFATYGIALDEPCARYVRWCQADDDVRAWCADAQHETQVIDAEEVGQ